MTYLVIKEDENILINKVGESIYMRSYPQKYSQKSQILGKTSYNDYYVSIDKQQNIHMVYKTVQNSIVHLTGKDTSFSSSTLLDDYENNYSITNLKIVSGSKSYLFYCALNPYEQTNDLIFHNFSDNSSPESLLALPSLTSKYQSFINGSKLYLICSILNNSSYELNIYYYNLDNEEWEGFDTLIASEYPITDFCCVIQDNGIHVTYVIEKFGHSTLYYGQMKNDQLISLEITATGQKIKPVLFIYNNNIWINYLTSQVLYASFSKNGGTGFSPPVRCTLQSTSITDLYLVGCRNPNLNGYTFLGYIDQQPNIGVLSQIDVDHILYYSSSNVELREMLKGSSENLSMVHESGKVEQLEKEVAYLKEMQRSITEQYNELANFTKDVQYEGKKWRKKYQKLSKDMKAKEIENAKKNNEQKIRATARAVEEILSDDLNKINENDDENDI